MKKFLTMLLVLCFVVTGTSFAMESDEKGSGILTGYGGDIVNGSLENHTVSTQNVASNGTQDVAHIETAAVQVNTTIARLSQCTFSLKNAINFTLKEVQGKDYEAFPIGHITVKNNTRDGYNLKVDSRNNFVLKATDRKSVV